MINWEEHKIEPVECRMNVILSLINLITVIVVYSFSMLIVFLIVPFLPILVIFSVIKEVYKK